MWDLFYKKPRLLILGIFLIAVAGLSSYMVMPRKEDPTLTQRFALVLTRYPGAGAEDVESLVTEKIEEELDEIQEIEELISVSRTNISVINVGLADTVRDVELVWSRVRDRLNDVRSEIPPEAQDPELELTTTEVDAFSMIVAITWTQNSNYPWAVLRRYAKELDDRFLVIAGTKQSEIFGAPEEEVLVEIDPDLLLSQGLDVSGLSRTVSQGETKIPGGSLRADRNELRIEVNGSFGSIDQLRRLPVLNNSQGQLIRLQDIAQVRKTVREPPDEVALIDGSAAITVSARVSEDYRIDHWAQDARKMVSEFQAGLPDGVETRILFDQSEYVQSRLNGLMINLILGGFFVLMVTSVMMGWRSGLIVGIALPLSCLSVFTGLYYLGIPLHQMSVTGLVIALGFLIDNAIIVVDEIKARIRQGLKSNRAVATGVRHLVIPLSGSTLTTALAFAPLVIMPGPAGEFVGSIAVSVILAIVSSFLISITVIATLYGFIGETTGRASSSWWSRGVRSEKLAQFYDRFLRFLFRKPVFGIVLALFLPLIGFWNFASLEEQFFPAADRKEFEIQIKLPPNSSIHETAALSREIHSSLGQRSEVDQIHWFVGGNAPKFYYNMTGGQDDTRSFAQALVSLKSTALNTEEFINSVQERLTFEYPQAEVIVKRFGQGPPVNAPIELHVYGPDLGQLWQIGEQFRAELVKDPRVTVARTSIDPGTPTLEFQVNEDEVRLSGLDSRSLTQQFLATLEGQLSGSIMEGTEELPVRVRAAESVRKELTEIAGFEFIRENSSTGESSRIPATALGRFEIVPELEAVHRRDGKRTNTIQAFLRAGVLPAPVLADFQSRIQEELSSLPPGVTFELGGDSKERNSAVSQLMASAGVLFVLLVAVLVLTFNSFRLAGTILMVAVSSIGLALLSIWLFNYPFGFMAIVGAMGLLGVAVNDSIVVLAEIRRDSASRSGDPDALVRSVKRSTRHVLTTTVTTVAGFLPLLISGGRFWPPLAIAIAGGIVGATFLALVFIPAVYRLLHSRSFRVLIPSEAAS